MFSLAEIATLLGAPPPVGADAIPARAVHDSRKIQQGDLFVAIRGARVDGHAYLDEALARGACGAIVADASRAPDESAGLIVVDDTVAALQQVASAWRNRLPGHVVGLTGSYGKTTTRTLLAHLLRRSRSVFETPANYNTEIGLPMALLSMTPEDEVGVFELGTERPGEIGLLASIVRPSTGILTGVGPSHLDGFESLDAIADEKWTLIDRLDADAIAFVNADSPQLLARSLSAECDVRTVGLDAGSVRGEIEASVPALIVRLLEPPLRLETRLLGEHNAVNVLLAVACALELGASPQEIEEAAESYRPPAHRLQALSAPFGTMLDDTYNANPASMRAALHVLTSYGAPGAQRVFVFGDMLGLGEGSDCFHREIATFAQSLGVDRILPAGARAANACRGLRGSDNALLQVADQAETLREMLRGDDNVVLIKGSRALALDELVEQLLPPGG